MKFYKCCYCKKRFKKKEMRAWYGSDILLYSHACIYCLERIKNNAGKD
jgi:hypothetical protein